MVRQSVKSAESGQSPASSAIVTGYVPSRRWLNAPGVLSSRGIQSLIVAGVFTVLYWYVRLPARREITPWYPVAPWG